MTELKPQGYKLLLAEYLRLKETNSELQKQELVDHLVNFRIQNLEADYGVDAIKSDPAKWFRPSPAIIDNIKYLRAIGKSRHYMANQYGVKPYIIDNVLARIKKGQI